MLDFPINIEPHGSDSFEIRDSKVLVLLTHVWWCIVFLDLVFSVKFRAKSFVTTRLCSI